MVGDLDEPCGLYAECPVRLQAHVGLRVAAAFGAAIWHNNKTGQSATRSLTAYDH
jgi:hypothetical protein